MSFFSTGSLFTKLAAAWHWFAMAAPWAWVNAHARPALEPKANVTTTANGIILIVFITSSPPLNPSAAPTKPTKHESESRLHGCGRYRRRDYCQNAAFDGFCQCQAFDFEAPAEVKHDGVVRRLIERLGLN